MRNTIMLSPDPVDTGGGGEAQAVAPEPTSISDDTMFVHPDGGDPMSWDDLQSKVREGHIPEASFTQKSQDHAAAVKKWETTKAEQEGQLQKYAQQLQQMQRQGQQPQQQDPRAALFQKMQERGWVDIGDFQAYDQMVNGYAANMNEKVANLEKTLQLMATGYQGLQSGLGDLTGQNTEQQMGDAVNAVMKKHGFDSLEGELPDTARNLLGRIAAAYEPSEGETQADVIKALDQYANDEIGQWIKLIQAQQSAKANEARDLKIPGPGSSPAPSSSGKPMMDPADISKTFWKRARGGPAV